MNPEEYGRMHALETEYWWFVGRRAIVRSMLDQALEQETKYSSLRLLDIGCGTGANLPMLCDVLESKSSDYSVAALDYSPLALEFAQDHLESKPVSLMLGDAVHLPFAENSFDFVTMLDVLEHVDNDRSAASEIYRVLKPGGAFVLTVPAYQKLWSAHDEALHHFRRYEYPGLLEVLKDSGFEIGKLSFAMSVMPPIAWFWRRFILPFKPRRQRDAMRHSQGAHLPAVPRWANKALVKYLAAEGNILKSRRIKFGTSLVAVARKPIQPIA